MSINLDYAFLMNEYITNQKSAQQIAGENNTYTLRVIRLLKKYGIPQRDRSASLELSHKKGNRKAPFEDGMPDEIKAKIGITSESKWDEARKERQAERMRQKWEGIPEEEKVETLKKLQRGLSKSSRMGSKLEKALEIYLVNQGYVCEPHKNLLQNDKLEVDLYLPALRTVVEINGPSHYTPIWGEEALAKQQKADQEKRGLLLTSGFRLVNIRVLHKTSRTRLNRLVKELEKAINGPKQFYEISL